MKIFNSLSAVTALLIASTSVALAFPTDPIPEPGSLGLVGLAVVGAIAAARARKR